MQIICDTRKPLLSLNKKEKGINTNNTYKLEYLKDITANTPTDPETNLIVRPMLGTQSYQKRI